MLHLQVLILAPKYRPATRIISLLLFQTELAQLMKALMFALRPMQEVLPGVFKAMRPCCIFLPLCLAEVPVTLHLFLLRKQILWFLKQ